MKMGLSQKSQRTALSDKGMNFKVFNDAVHGHMSFDPLLVKIIDTPQMQRLRNLKQLGLAYFVYPSACHNRFEHSLGTCHLAGKLLDALEPTMEPQYRPTEQERLSVLIAGLCHDLGHGPFSHTWEYFVRRARSANPGNSPRWHHENSSIEILDLILSSPGMKAELQNRNMKEEHLQLIRDLIKVPENITSDKYYLYQIISNKDNDIDVDKWDYLLRDQMLLNISSTFNVGRLVEHCRVFRANGRLEICFRDNVKACIQDMLIARANLHEHAYQHRVVKIIETMVVDCFLAAHRACPEWDLTNTSAGNLGKLTDCLLFDRIRNSDDERLQEARHLVTKIETRKNYLCIHEHECSPAELKLKPDLTEDDYNKMAEGIRREINENSNNNCCVGPADIEVVPIKIDMGSKYNDRGPNCFYFTKHPDRPNEALLIDGKAHLLASSLKKILKRELLVLYKKEDIDMKTTKVYKECAARYFDSREEELLSQRNGHDEAGEETLNQRNGEQPQPALKRKKTF